MPQARLAAFAASTLYLLSRTPLMTARSIGPHNLYVLLAMLTLMATARFLTTRQLAYFYAAVASLGLASLTLEYAAVLAMALAGCLAVSHDALTVGRTRRDVLLILMRAGLLFLLIFCLAWPAGILKLSVIKNYLFFIYFAMHRSRAYGSDPVWQVWLGRFLASPVEYGAGPRRGRLGRGEAAPRQGGKMEPPVPRLHCADGWHNPAQPIDQPPVRLVTGASAARVGRPRRRTHGRTVDDSANGRRRGGANGHSGELLLEPTSRRPREIDISG